MLLGTLDIPRDLSILAAQNPNTSHSWGSSGHDSLAVSLVLAFSPLLFTDWPLVISP